MDILYKTNTGSYDLPSETIKDIALGEVISFMTSDEEEHKILKEVMSRIPLDTSDMIYRQEIVKDLMDNDDLCNAVRDSMDLIKVLRFYGSGAKNLHDNDNSFASLLESLRELKVFVNVVESLYTALSGNNIRSEGLTGLKELLGKIVEDGDFKTVKPDIEKIHEDLSQAKGAVIGVTFTPELDIENVTAIEFTEYKPRSAYTIMDYKLLSVASNPHAKYKYQDPLLTAITPHLKKHLRKYTGEIKRLIRKHSKYDTRLLTDLYNGFVFYLHTVSLGKKLSSGGYVISYPDISQNKSLEVKGLYNIRLALKGEDEIVKNDFSFPGNDRIYILTGPNRGGKTILEQSLGLISVMASLGMFVTAGSCEGLPFRNILTHFPIDENLTINYGRLGEEAVRIRELVKNADSNTLLLFNETFSTTSSADALYLCKDLLHILKDKGSFVIFNTHIHELAACIDEMNGWDGKSKMVSLVMEIKDNRPTFKVKRSAPDTSSYAHNIAEKYGILYGQMKDL